MQPPFLLSLADRPNGVGTSGGMYKPLTCARHQRPRASENPGVRKKIAMIKHIVLLSLAGAASIHPAAAQRASFAAVAVGENDSWGVSLGYPTASAASA